MDNEEKKSAETAENQNAETQAGTQNPDVNEETASQQEPEEAEPKETRKERKEIKALKAENEKLSKALAETEDKYKRMIAEYDNFRKRTAKESEGIYANAFTDALKEMLPVKDALEMAVGYQGDAVLDGVKMTLSKFADALSKLGIEEMGKEGEAFDPNLHNAVMHIDDDALGENVIAQVLMKGYKKGDRVLRHAMVKVAN